MTKITYSGPLTVTGALKHPVVDPSVVTAPVWVTDADLPVQPVGQEVSIPLDATGATSYTLTSTDLPDNFHIDGSALVGMCNVASTVFTANISANDGTASSSRVFDVTFEIS